MTNAILNISVFLYERIFSILLDIYLGVELRGHPVTLFKFLRKCRTVVAPILSHEEDINFSAVYTSILLGFDVCTIEPN